MLGREVGNNCAQSDWEVVVFAMPKITSLVAWWRVGDLVKMEGHDCLFSRGLGTFVEKLQFMKSWMKGWQWPQK